MKKKVYVVGVAVLLAALLALSGVAQSAMWVGAELGGNFPLNSDIKVGGFGTGSTPIMASVIGGAIIGYDFVNEGFGARAWPDWMRYFSFAMDITYNKMNVASGRHGIARALPGGSYLEGYNLAWTFLFMAHYGFFPDSEIPTGRVIPYIGVGPAIVWSGTDAGSFGVGAGTATNVALVVEPGIRWMCMKNVSIDTAMRYRRLEPSFDVSNVTVKVPLNMLAFLVRANYHF
jgi:opacity protein-like surface antigen